ncbi:hypothetical protein [Glaciibacter sp. 2TAF33]|uniref:aggregation-promoting factor C-terminal-like domain-containing protein n=1 Tax=Glaciibacter sp. 2TAF33 TaxID=3233015 RepID=UPI003F93E7A3
MSHTVITPAIRGFFTRTKLITLIAIGVAAVILTTVSVGQSNAARAERVAATAQLSESTGLQSDQLTAYPVIAKAQADHKAAQTIGTANQIIAAVQDKVDATQLASSVASLSNYSTLDAFAVRTLTQQTEVAASQVQAAAAEADRVAAEAAAAAAEAQRVANTPDGARATARAMAAAKYGWGEAQFSCLNQLWNKESGWSYTAGNASSGATGIPQALPGSKMASAGADWATNATTQISWGLDYIQRGYGTPCAAMSHSAAMNWY